MLLQRLLAFAVFARLNDMPKRATHTFESEKDGLKDADLNVFYCLCCGESVLILGPGVELTALPRRKTDGAYALERPGTVFKLNTKEGETKLLRREKGYERQYRFNCWNCDVQVGYRCEPEKEARLTYILHDALGAQADLYLQLYKVPPCIQATGPESVRVAMEVSAGQPKMAVTGVTNGEVAIAVTAPAREGLANAEVLEHMARVLGVPRTQLQLSRGWSQKSKFLMVSGISAVDVFKKIRGSVETDLLPLGMRESAAAATGGGGGDEMGPAATAGAASGVARRQWEEGEELDDLAAAPSIKEQRFRD